MRGISYQNSNRTLKPEDKPMPETMNSGRFDTKMVRSWKDRVGQPTESSNLSLSASHSVSPVAPKRSSKSHRNHRTPTKTPTIEVGMLTVKQVAEIENVTTKCVLGWCQRGVIPCLSKSFGVKTTFTIHPDYKLYLKRPESKAIQREKAKKEKPHLDYVSPWLTALSSGGMNGKVYSPSTIDYYGFYVKQYLERHTKIAGDEVACFIAASPIEQFGRRSKAFKALVSFTKYLVSQHALEEAVMGQLAALRPKAIKPPKRTVITHEEYMSLIQATNSTLEQALVILLGETGLRVSELIALQASDIDSGNRILTVRCGKGGRYRRIGITTRAMGILQPLLTERVGVLLVTDTGKPLTRMSVFKRLQSVGKRCNVTVTCHAMRRFFITHNAALGKPLPILQLAAGHSDIKTTMGYVRLDEQAVIDAMRQW